MSFGATEKVIDVRLRGTMFTEMWIVMELRKDKGGSPGFVRSRGVIIPRR